MQLSWPGCLISTPSSLFNIGVNQKTKFKSRPRRNKKSPDDDFCHSSGAEKSVGRLALSGGLTRVKAFQLYWMFFQVFQLFPSPGFTDTPRFWFSSRGDGNKTSDPNKQTNPASDTSILPFQHTEVLVQCVPPRPRTDSISSLLRADAESPGPFPPTWSGFSGI